MLIYIINIAPCVLIVFYCLCSNVKASTDSSYEISQYDFLPIPFPQHFYDKDFNQGILDDICTLPPHTGICTIFQIRYHYNISEKRCVPFVYGGCNGNENNFKKYTDCQIRCTRNKKISKRRPSFCFLKPEKGINHCLAIVIRYYYNVTTKQCQKFIYGGCQATKNNFNLKAVCDNVCNFGNNQFERAF